MHPNSCGQVSEQPFKQVLLQGLLQAIQCHSPDLCVRILCKTIAWRSPLISVCFFVPVLLRICCVCVYGHGAHQNMWLGLKSRIRIRKFLGRHESEFSKLSLLVRTRVYLFLSQQIWLRIYKTETDFRGAVAYAKSILGSEESLRKWAILTLLSYQKFS